MMMRSLDLGLVRTFALVADVGGFTAAAALSGATQSAISMRIKKLEDRLGQRLFLRTPRSMALTPFGESFLPDALALLDHHDGVVRRFSDPASVERLNLGITEHFADAALPELLRALATTFPALRPRVTVGPSECLEAAFTSGRHDVVVVRTDALRVCDRVVARDRLVWVAGGDHFDRDRIWSEGMPVPLVGLAESCQLHGLAREALRAAGLTWTDVFTGGGLQTVQAAVRAGFGVACLDRRNQPRGCHVLGLETGLPALPDSQFIARYRQDNAGLPPIVDALATVLGGSA